METDLLCLRMCGNFVGISLLSSSIYRNTYSLLKIILKIPHRVQEYLRLYHRVV